VTASSGRASSPRTPSASATTASSWSRSWRHEPDEQDAPRGDVAWMSWPCWLSPRCW
jgi:hypothetical protein